MSIRVLFFHTTYYYISISLYLYLSLSPSLSLFLCVWVCVFSLRSTNRSFWGNREIQIFHHQRKRGISGVPGSMKGVLGYMKRGFWDNIRNIDIRRIDIGNIDIGRRFLKSSNVDVSNVDVSNVVDRHPLFHIARNSFHPAWNSGNSTFPMMEYLRIARITTVS